MDSTDHALFVEIVDAGTFSAAARNLNISTAMASKRLARLEQRLGARLIHRTTRRLAPTEQGRLFYDRVAPSIAAIREAELSLANAAATAEGRLRVSAPTSFGRMHIAPHLGRFIDAHPRLQLAFELDDAYVNLLASRIDLAIRIGPAPDVSLDAQWLAPNTRILCASPDYIARHGTPTGIAQLIRHRMLAAEGQLPWRLEGPEGPVTVRGSSIVRTNSSEVVRELTLAGAGISLRSIWDIHHELADGRLVRILDPYAGISGIAIHAVYPRTDFLPVNAGRFIAFLRDLFDPVPPWEAGS